MREKPPGRGDAEDAEGRGGERGAQHRLPLSSRVCALSILVAASCLPAVEVPLNGGFAEADPQDARRPLGWALPDGLGVRWEEASTARGRAIRMETGTSERAMVARWRELGIDEWDIPNPAGNAVADTYGLSFYSAPFACAPQQAYRVRTLVKGPAGGIKVWVRGYGTAKDGERHRIYEAVGLVDPRTPPDADGFVALTHVFHPTRNTPKVEELRVMLYAYHPAATYWFDDVVVEPVSAEDYAAELAERKQRLGR